MNDEERNLARSARVVQNLQLKLLAGTILGAVVGFLVGVYLVFPALDKGLVSFIGVIASLVVGGLVGQRLILSMVAH